jgi:hypothetical protein
MFTIAAAVGATGALQLLVLKAIFRAMEPER